VTRKALVLVVALGALRDPCGTQTSAVGLYAPCTRTKDCDNGLSCVDGVCSLGDGGAPDTGLDAGEDGTGGDGPAAD
jgi:hypothetical protein